MNGTVDKQNDKLKTAGRRKKPAVMQELPLFAGLASEPKDLTGGKRK